MYLPFKIVKDYYMFSRIENLFWINLCKLGYHPKPICLSYKLLYISRTKKKTLLDRSVRI